MVSLGTEHLSRYIRTSWMISAETELELPDTSKIRHMGQAEVTELAERVRKRNVFARHSWENNFYLQRIRELGDKTIIEVYRPGDPQEMYDVAVRAADLLEKTAILSTTLAVKRDALHRRMGISLRPREEIDFVVGANYRYLKSTSNPEAQATGLVFDGRARRRFERCGFATLYDFCLSSNRLARRVSVSLDWLSESRMEPKLSAAVVKTAIALESLLIFSDSEALARSLSERIAFLLTSSPEVRHELSRIIKGFYNVRSGVVHGSKKKLRRLSPQLVESVDRLSLLIHLVIASNSAIWASVDDLRQWCEGQRWGDPAKDVTIPFPPSYLTNAMRLAEKN